MEEKYYEYQPKEFKKLNPTLYSEVEIYGSKILNKKDILFKECLFLFVNEIKEPVKCKCCDNPVRFKSFKMGYVSFCSNECSGKWKRNLSQEEKNKINNKRRNTNKIIYGVDNVAKSKIIQEKIFKTNEYRYNTYFPLFNDEIKQKKENTNNKNWGGHPLSNNDKIIERSSIRKQTMYEKWLKSIESILDLSIYKIINIDKSNRNITLECIICNYKEIYAYEFIKQRYKLGTCICKNCNPLYSLSPTKNLETLNKYKNIELNDIHILKYNNSEFECEHISKNHIFFINRKILYDRKKDGVNLCTLCYPITDNKSIKEKELINWLKELNIEFIEGDRTVISPKELDIYIPSSNIAIEFNGLYYHSENLKPIDYHLNKTIGCIEKGIQLLHIWEDEWVFKQDIIKSIILNKLGLISENIYARKCEVKEVKDSKLVRKFLDDNHIQGYSSSSIKLGLFYNNELVSLMTFGSRYSNKKKELELLRFCNKINFNVVGAASKLFNFFKNNYQFNNLITYSDFRLFDGKIYEKLGFEKDKLSKPDYYWCKNLERLHKFNFSKSKLIKQGYDNLKTETEIMWERGYYKLYNCGLYRWNYIN